MTIQEALKKIQDQNPSWTFAQCWRQLRNDKPELFSSSLRPLAPDNVPDEPYAHPTGTDSPDPRARPFKNYVERSRDERIASTAFQKELAEKVAVIRASNPSLSFRQVWERVKRDGRLMARCAVIEARLATSL